MTRRWIQKAIKRPGRVRRYIYRKYGRKAFRGGDPKRGEIKQVYINRAIRSLKRRKTKNRSLLQALYLARRLERIHKG